MLQTECHLNCTESCMIKFILLLEVIGGGYINIISTILFPNISLYCKMFNMIQYSHFILHNIYGDVIFCILYSNNQIFISLTSI